MLQADKSEAQLTTLRLEAASNSQATHPLPHTLRFEDGVLVDEALDSNSKESSHVEALLKGKEVKPSFGQMPDTLS